MNSFRSVLFSCIIILQVMDSNAASTPKYVFYLHGMIVENMGAKAVSPYFGAYQYDDILDAFRKAGFTVMSEVRKPNTDVKEYATTIAKQINDLLKKGVESKNITVIGASKGALIAMHVSAILKNKELNFVFLAACNDGNFQAFPEIQFYGNILSIYEKSDDIGESCASFREKSVSTISRYKEIEINTGLQHGFLFKPVSEWTKPAMEWANGIYE
ncbi:MAG: alpha/beta hydrolase [Chitinophagales bacterium]